MRKIFLSLFAAFFLLIAPIAQEAGMSCEGDSCPVSEQEEKQDNEKMAGVGHHCCCSHVSAIPDMTVAEPAGTSKPISFVFDQDSILSIVVRSPLKPPSHA
jgi:hypothetical protein